MGLKDIADELGISQTAVSFAINDRPGVSGRDQRRVKEAASKLGWSPVYAAQALGSSKTMTVGFAPARSSNGLRDEGSMLHFMTGLHEIPESQRLRSVVSALLIGQGRVVGLRGLGLDSKRVDGVILVDLRADDPRPALLAGSVCRLCLQEVRILRTSCPRCRLTIQAPWKRFSDIWYHADTGVSHTYRGPRTL